MQVAIALLLLLCASARAEVPDVPRVLGVTATATSTAKTRDPAFVLDSHPTKMWCEGKADEGVGEALVLKLAGPTRIDSLTIRAGVWQSPELFHAANRITQLRVVTDDGKDQIVKFREERENVDVAIGRTVSEIRLEIAAVAKGKVNDSCISGVDIHADPDAAVVPGMSSTAQYALEPAFAKTWTALATCDEAGLRAQLAFPFVFVHRFADAKAVRKACKDKQFAAFEDDKLSLHVKAPAPGSLVLATDKLEWHFVVAGKSWRLASLVDLTR